MKKNALFIGIFVLALFSQPAFAQNNFCQVSFIEETFSLDSGDTQSVFLTVKNNSVKDFFVDLLSFENNGLFSQGQSNGAKIFAENYGLVEMKLTPNIFESEKSQTVTAFLTGHFEDGQRCFLDKEFFFLIRPVKTEKDPVPVVSFSQEIDKSGSGFITISIDNPSENEMEVRARATNAGLGKTVIYAGPFSSISQAISVNNAVDDEIIYFTVYSENGFLEEKFVRLIVPQAPQEVLNLLPEPQIKKGFVVSSYSSKVTFLGDRAEVWVEVSSISENPQNIFIELKNLPQGISASTLGFSLEPGQSRQAVIEVQGKSPLEMFNAILYLQGEVSTSREIVFEKPPAVAAPSFPAETAGQDDFAGVGLVFLGQNWQIFLVVILVLFIVMLVATQQKHRMYRQSWIAETN